ncbi:MAG: ABC transporter ATP-binding protein [Verrucomicrobiota bacterium]
MQQYRRLLQYPWSQRRAFLLILLLTLASTLATALQPWPIKLVVDHVLATNEIPAILKSLFRAAHVQPSGNALLIFAVVGGLLIFAINSFIESALALVWTRSGRRMIFDLAEELFAAFQRRSILFHKRHSVGDVMARITGDSWCTYLIADSLFFAPIHAALILAATFFLMWQLDPKLTWVSVLTAPVMVIASAFMGKSLRAAAKSKREIESNIQSHLQQTLAGMPVVQAFEQQHREQSRFQDFAAAAIRNQQRSAFLLGIANLGSGLVAAVGSGVVLWIGSHRVVAGQMTIGSLLAFLAYLAILQVQFKVFAGLFPALQQHRASADRVIEILNAEPEIPERAQPLSLQNVRGEIRFENVTCGYETSRPVLRHVNLTIAPGEIIALVGASGAGKTTLTQLVPRFLDLTEGRVLVDGHDVRDLELASLRQNISLVFQDSVLLPVSIADNISFGRPSATRAEIISAAVAAGANDFIQKMPEGYDTVVGERGATLSGGERQRIAIARAFLKNAPIVILDEPTSALDSQTEAQIMSAFESLLKGRTALIVAHRLSTIRHAHRIAVMQQGTICEVGTHEELMLRGGHYARLHDVQFAKTDNVV